MADRFNRLKNILSGTKARGKNPTERPNARQQRRVFDTFYKSAQAMWQQSMIGAAQRQERFRDYEEMDQSPEISTALNIFADDSTTLNEVGTLLDIESDDENIVKELEELYYERLNIEDDMWIWMRNLVKYGDNYLLLDIVEEKGVLGVLQLPTIEIDREEGYDGDPNSVRFKWLSQGNTIFESYQISHLRLKGDDRFLPYGRSILEPARKVFKQLTMAEDAMLIYRFTRAPERRIFYVDVGNIPPKDVSAYMQQARDELSRTPHITESNGQIDLRYNPISITEDLYIPVRGERGSRVETLPGGQNQGDIEDINYIQNKLFVALGVPKTYLTGSEEGSLGKSSLAQEDIKFARTIQRIQRVAVSELAKIGLIHLYLKGYNENEIYNFDLRMTNPSTVMEMMQLDLIDKRYDIAAKMKDSGLVDMQYIQEEILALSDFEISKINSRVIDDARKKSLLAKIEGGEDAGEDSGMSGGAAPDMGAEEDTKDTEEEPEEGTSRVATAVPDPTGHAGVPGSKDYTKRETSVVNDFGDDDETGISDKELFIVNPNKLRGKKKKRNIDIFDRAITDCMRMNSNVNGVMEILKLDKAADKLKLSTFTKFKKVVGR